MKRLVLVLPFIIALIFVTQAEASAPPIAVCQTSTKNVTNVKPLVIPVTGTVSSKIPVSGVNFSNQPGYIWDVDVTTKITHSSNSDLEITLTSPSGTVVTLTSNNGGGNNDVFNGTTWDDSADPDGQVPYTTNNGLVTDHSFTSGVTATPLVPEEGLIAFKNENPNGVWTLTIHDDKGGDSGMLNEWGLNITAIPQKVGFTGGGFTTIVNSSIPDVGTLTSTRTQPSGIICHMSVKIDIDHTFSGDLDITLTSPGGKVVTLTSDNGSSNDNVFAGTRFTSFNDLGSPVPYTGNPNIVSDHTYYNNVVAELLTPEESLAQFYGIEQAGLWTLKVSDDAAQDFGVLNSWEISISECPIPNGDSDGDGFSNGCDGCDHDPNKVDAGQCGCNVADTDSDSDGFADCVDTCPNDGVKGAPGVCGCGVPDNDSDSDGTLNCLDQCPSDPLKTAPGQCGCGIVETDFDSDGTANCADLCPQDPLKAAPGSCGCGFLETDSDKDGAADCIETCSFDPAKTEPGICGCGISDIDSNANGIADCKINAELIARSNTAIALIKKLKPTLKGNKRKAAKTLASSALKELKTLLNSGGIFSLASNKINLKKLSTNVNKSSKAALKLNEATFIADKKAAIKALKAVGKSVVSEQ